MSGAVNVLALVRDGQRYVFLYDDQSVETVLHTLGQFARDPELDFTWHDAAILARQIHDLHAEQPTSDDFSPLF